MRRKSLTSILCVLLLLGISTTGCSTIKKATSDAYNIGYQTGQEFANLGDIGTLINSYLPDDSDTQLGGNNGKHAITSRKRQSAKICKAILQRY